MKDDIGLRNQLDNHLWEWSSAREASQPVEDVASRGLQLIQNYASRKAAQEQQLADTESDKARLAVESEANLAAAFQARVNQVAALEAELIAERAAKRARTVDLKAKQAVIVSYRNVVKLHLLVVDEAGSADATAVERPRRYGTVCKCTPSIVSAKNRSGS